MNFWRGPSAPPDGSGSGPALLSLKGGYQRLELFESPRPASGMPNARSDVLVRAGYGLEVSRDIS